MMSARDGVALTAAVTTGLGAFLFLAVRVGAKLSNVDIPMSLTMNTATYLLVGGLIALALLYKEKGK